VMDQGVQPCNPRKTASCSHLSMSVCLISMWFLFSPAGAGSLGWQSLTNHLYKQIDRWW
jgi:hypothetical protein